MSIPTWKIQRLAVMLATGLLLFASYTPSGLLPESLLLQLAARVQQPLQTDTGVVVVAIDDSALASYGPWPWPRDLLARVVKRLQAFSPRAIGLPFPLDETQSPERIKALREGLDALDEELRVQAGDWLQQLDTDAQLASAIKAAGNVVLAAAAPLQSPDAATPSLPRRFLPDYRTTEHNWRLRLKQALLAPPIATAQGMQPPLEIFTAGAAAVGILPERRDRAATALTDLVYRTDAQFVPGFELALYAVARGIESSSLVIAADSGLLLQRGEVLGSVGLRHAPLPARPVPVYSLREIMRTDPFARRLRDKVVILGVTANGLSPRLHGPDGTVYPYTRWSAQSLNSLLSGHGVTVPGWFHGGQRALLLLFGLYLLLAPAGWHGLRGVAITLPFSLLIINAGLVTLLVENLWLPLTGPALFLALAQLMLYLSHRRYRSLLCAWHDTVEARIALGNNLQSQGQLDLALQQFLPCLPAPAALEPLYQLGHEYERRRQIGKARTVYETLRACGKGYRDSAARHSQLADFSDRFPSSGNGGVEQTRIIDSPVMELPVLGRYRLERELGRGAMGTVYLAVDPTIGREVAIKTLPLLEHYAEPEQEAVAQRFLKEAEAVGRLDHPNIVTIYDAGKEHDLAYMTMDYASGRSLDEWIRSDGLLPVWEVLEIAAQVADALHYAHGRKVVHRDIKPGNIIYDRDSGTVKITDFGVARMLDSSRTRTGTVLGSPSYMSPEQVAGRKTDGRSDLFSLGVTLYQLLTGSLPFSGDSVATLMYQITSQKAPPVRKQRRGLPVCIGRLVAKALQKEPAKRFTSGAAMAETIRKCRAQVRGGRRKTA